MSELRWSPEHATEIGWRILTALGTPDRQAALVATSLAGANLCGHDSHGLIRLPWYAEFVPDGRAVPAAEPTVSHETDGVAVIDGGRCWGQVAGHLAVDVVRRKAYASGVGVAAVRNANHVGRLGEYAEALAADGLVSLMWANADPAVAPYGGRRRMLGTNPFAAGVPAGTQPPVIVDFATAAVAEGQLRLDRVAGRSVAPGLIQDVDGRPSTDPEDFYAGGSLLPFGLHKGFGLALLIELLGGALSGNHVGFLPDYVWGNGFVLICLAPDAFGAAATFGAEVARACAELRASPPAEGTAEVLLPGDPERLTRHRRRRDGIPVPTGVHEQLSALAEQLGTSLQ